MSTYPPSSDSFQEITRPRPSEEDASRQKQTVRLQSRLIELAHDAIIVRDSTSTIVSWNRGAEELYGWTAQEAIGNITHTLLKTCFPESREALDTMLAAGEQWDGELVHTRRDGTEVVVESRQVLLRDEAGQPGAILEINRDITERKQRERENQEHYRTVVQMAAAQEHFLAEVSKVLTSTLDYQETLANITRLVVPQLADWFSVDLVDAGGHFELIEVGHKDPEQVQWARALREKYPIDPNAPTGAPRVVHTGQSELYPEITDEMLVTSTRNEEELAIARQIGLTSVIYVPLVARGRTIGVVTFVSTELGRNYDERDLALAEEIGRRAGVAIDNARLYQEVKQARDQLDIILQGVADGIVVYDRNGHIIYANEAAASINGYASVEAMMQMPPQGIVARYKLIDEQGHPFPLSQRTHRRVLAGEREAQAIIGYRDPTTGQSERWSFVKSRPVFDEQGKVFYAITIIHDITERMLAEWRKDEFISMASHELKTPVTSLKGFTNVLQRRLAKQGDAQGLHFLARVDAQLDKLTALITDLLDISKMQAGKLELREEAFDLDALVQETVENVQAATSTHHLLVDGKAEAWLMGDKDRLGQVLTNLLTNAVKYSPKADRVIVRASRDTDYRHAIISVQDFGIGIDEAHHQKIFECFYQVTNPEERTFPGLGIGLYISYEIVKRHNGRMWVESRKGEGAIFFVALPVTKEEEQVSLPLQAGSKGMDVYAE